MRGRFLLPALAVLIGCADAVDPTVGVDAPFSLYGYLDPTADRQLLRVAPITGTIDPDSTGIDAVVTSTDLETGETVAWRDSLATFADGSTGWVFIGDVTPRPRSTVRLAARRSDGAEAVVDVDVPPIAPAQVGSGEVTLGEVTYRVAFSGAPRVLSGRLQLVVDDVPGVEGVTTFEIPLDVAPEEVAEDEWAVEIPFLTAANADLRARGLADIGVTLVNAVYTGFVANETWSPPTDDLDALVEPGTFSNVVGGFGFVGGGYLTSATWAPSPLVAVSAGFGGDGRPGAAVRINEVRLGPGGWVELYNPLLTDARIDGFSLSNSEQDPDRLVLPAPTLVPAGDFLVVPLPFEVEGQQTLGLYAPGDERVHRFFVEVPFEGGADAFTFGSWPDGRSLRFPRLPDVFQGLLTPTPGQPNELPGQPAAINEVYTEGWQGWAEAVPDAAFDVQRLWLLDERVELPDADPVGVAAFAVADEGTTLRLSQLGGEVYLVARYQANAPDQAGGFRVVDVRPYGPQTPGRSVGYLPDGPGGIWTEALAPTRGAPNAAARLGR